MNCREIQRKFSQFFDDLLSGKKNKALFDHLSECQRCRKAWNRFNSIFNSLRCLPKEDPPFDITSGVMARIQELEEQKCWWKRLFTLEGFRPLAGALTVAILAIVAFNLYQRPYNRAPSMELTNLPRGIEVTSRVENRKTRKAMVSPGQFAATVAPFPQKRYTVVTLYVDDVEEAERKINSLASRVILKKNYQPASRYPQKVLTQFRMDIPVTELEFLLRELTKIGQVNHARGQKPSSMGKRAETSIRGGGLELKVAEKTSAEAIVGEISRKRKMGQGFSERAPVVPVNVVVVSKDGK